MSCIYLTKTVEPSSNKPVLRTQSTWPNMLKTFPHFKKLPPEIRLMIWQEALPDSRVYEVLDTPKAKQKTPPHVGLMFTNFHGEPPPVLAAVCQESRYFVLQHYKPLTLSGTTKYLDVSRDVLLLEPYLLIKRLLRTLHLLSQIPLVRDNMHRLALGTSYGVYTGIHHPMLSWKTSKNTVPKLLERLSQFPHLMKLIFIIHQDFRFDFDLIYPQFPISQLHRPQVVHQAYRFKFDIESNINHHCTRRPHVNELLYYPLDIDEEDDRVDLDEEDPEWCDPWPTNDDWRRFRRRVQRAINTTVEPNTQEPLKIGRPPILEGASLLWRYTKDGCY